MLKRCLLIGCALLTVTFGFADYMVNYEGPGETKTYYASGNVTLSGIDWNLTEALIGTESYEVINGIRSARMRGFGTSAMTMLANKDNGIGMVSLLHRRFNSTDPQREWKVEYSVDNGSSWTQAGGSFTANEEVQTFTALVNVLGSARIRIKPVVESGATANRINIDDITLTDYFSPDPVLVVNPSLLSGFHYEFGQGPSASQSYQILGSNLLPPSGTIAITGSASFEVSADNVDFFFSTSLPYSGGSISQTLYLRLKEGLNPGLYYNENISHSGGGFMAMLTANGSVTSANTSLTLDGYYQNFTSFVSMDTLPVGWSLSDSYTYGGYFGYGSAGGLRGEGTFGIQLTATAPNNNLTAVLTLINDTSSTLEALNISYLGRVERVTEPGTPKWIVCVNGEEIPELEFDTADGVNALRSTTLTGLNIPSGGAISFSWFTTSAGTSGVRRQIGITDLNINTNFAVNPSIDITADLTAFETELGTPSAAQSYFLSSTALTSDILVSAPFGFELSTDDLSYYGTLTLPATYAADVYVRMTGTQAGVYGANIVHSSAGVMDTYLPVVGTVTGESVGYATDLLISEYIEGSSYNKALEIFNGTPDEVDLSDYQLETYFNGGLTPQTMALSGTLAQGEVFVVAHGSAAPAILAVANATNNNVANFNGDDAIALKKISTGGFVDIFGVIGNDPGDAWTGEGGYSTQNKTLVRKATVNAGITENPSGTGPSAFTTLVSQWDLYDQDTFTFLGFHDFEYSGEEVFAPTQQASNIILYPANNEITAEWTPGNGARRIVKINTSNTFTPPVDGTSPIANTYYGGSGEQVVFNGATQIIDSFPFNGVSVSGLAPNTTYWFRVYEYNGTGSGTRYNIASGVNNPISGNTTNTQTSGYYAGITGYGSMLKTNLHTLVRTTHTTPYSYNALWIQLPYTDEDPENTDNVVEIYTGWSVPKTHYGEGTTTWNREHTWSKSHGDFGDVAPAGTDLHHLRPCDSTVNSAKSNKDFDNGGVPYVDASPYPGYSGDTGCYTTAYSWEPRDEDKGDVARMIMYMAVRYEGTDTSYDLEIVDYVNSEGGTNAPYYGKLSTLLSWHVEDPPDAREMQRNDRIHERQGNRNPFIDHPEFARQIWSPVPLSATNVGPNGFTAQWSTPISATKYFLQVATDSLFLQTVPGYANYDAGLTTGKVISGLDSGTTYYFRLRSYFLSGYSMYSTFLSVTTTSPVQPTAALSAEYALNEANLEGAVLTVELSDTAWMDSILLPGNFMLNNVPAGLTILSVNYLSPVSASLVLSFDGSDFDDNASLTLTIAAVEITAGSDLTSSALTIIAHVESLVSIDLQSGLIILNIVEVENAAGYKIFASGQPDGIFTEATPEGVFDPLIPTRWSFDPAGMQRRFFKAVGYRN